MTNYQRARDHEDGIDFMPLITVPAHEQDVTDQHLPTYDEALALSNQEAQTAPQRRAEEQARRARAPTGAITSALANEPERDPKQLRRLVHRGKWVVVCMGMTPGVGLTIGAVVAYNLLAQAWLTLAE